MCMYMMRERVASTQATLGCVYAQWQDCRRWFVIEIVRLRRGRDGVQALGRQAQKRGESFGYAQASEEQDHGERGQGLLLDGGRREQDETVGVRLSPAFEGWQREERQVFPRCVRRIGQQFIKESAPVMMG